MEQQSDNSNQPANQTAIVNPVNPTTIKPPYNKFKDGLEIVIGKLNYKRSFHIYTKKSRDRMIERFVAEMPKEQLEFFKHFAEMQENTIDLFMEFAIRKMEEILVRTGHLTLRHKKCTKCPSLYQPVDRLSRMCPKCEKKLRSRIFEDIHSDNAIITPNHNEKI